MSLGVRSLAFVDSLPFTAIVVATIAINAVVLGLQTYAGVERRWGGTLDLLNAACQVER